MVGTQKNRKIQVFTSLAEDTLLFYRMHGREGLSEPFEYSVELVSEQRSIDPEKLLGEPLTIRLQLEDGNWRHFHGFVSRFGQHVDLNRFARYHATVRPWLWFLTRTSNCRIFQNQSVPEIIKQVFQDHGFNDFKEKLSGSYATREYCVQYRETDFNFISRLMEDEGIYYYFTHEKDKHYLVLADSGSAHDPFPGYDNIPYHVDTAPTDRTRKDHIHAWTFAREVQPGACEFTDYDFKKPKANLAVKSILKNSHSHAEYELFDYHPGRYMETGIGDNLVRQRIEEHHTRFERGEGKGNARGLAVGCRFKLQEFPRQDQNRDYLVISANYHLLLDEYASGPTIGEEQLFDCSFTVQDNKRPYRAPRSTLKPFVHGAQTAVVTGPAGEEIHTDKYGRVKVQFHWDRYGNKDHESSCWIRVSQPWAGKNWGIIAIPRIGQEVIVDFLEGDPDQPIIIGNVYNADVMPPYPLPGGAVISGMKSNTHKGQGYNEMSMDDTAGNEKITIHGQYDMNTTVRHDQTNTIMNHRTTTVQNGNDTLTVATGTRTVTVKGDSTHIVQAGSRVVQVTAADYIATAAQMVNLHGKGKGVGITGDVEGVVITGNGKGVGITGNDNGVGITGNAKGVTIVGNGQGVGITGNDNGVGIKGEAKGVFIEGNGEGVTIVGTPAIYCEGKSDLIVKSPKVYLGENEITIQGKTIVLSTDGGSITIDSSGITIQGTIGYIN
jgi:type VI secretion system secreted protein VgrG